MSSQGTSFCSGLLLAWCSSAVAAAAITFELGRAGQFEQNWRWHSCKVEPNSLESWGRFTETSPSFQLITLECSALSKDARLVAEDLLTCQRLTGRSPAQAGWIIGFAPTWGLTGRCTGWT